jgi:hypothetical protein
MSEGTPIVQILDPDPGGNKPVKVPALFGAGHDYRINIVYVLADGVEIPTVHRNKLLRDAKAYKASLPGEPTNLSANFHDGEFVGTTWKVDTLAFLSALT